MIFFIASIQQLAKSKKNNFNNRKMETHSQICHKQYFMYSQMNSDCFLHVPHSENILVALPYNANVQLLI